MADDESVPEVDESDEELDPIAAIQDALSDIDPEALVAGFVCVVEWIEPDGSSALSLLHSPMPPWHRDGLLKHAQEFETPLFPVLIELDDEDWDE